MDVKPVFLRTGNNYDRDAKRSVIRCSAEEDRTAQEFSEDADVNVIVKRFGLGQALPFTAKVPLTGDFTAAPDFQTAMNMVRAAQEAFMQLSPELRERFGHDPGMMIRFLENPENRDEAVKLGLVSKPAEKVRDVVQAVDELAKSLVPRETKKE